MKNSTIVDEGYDLYKRFTDVITLKKNYRLKHAKRTSTKKFLENQLKVGDGDCKDTETIKYFKQFQLSNNVQKRKEFENDPDTKYLVTTNPEADRINAEFVHKYAQENNKIITSWAAWNTTMTAIRARHDKVWGLR